MDTALITFCIVLLATLVLACIWVSVRGRRLRDDNKPKLTNAAKRFVADMVKALQRNAMNDFKKLYRTVDALLIDDIQFFAGKDRSQC